MSEYTSVKQNKRKSIGFLGFGISNTALYEKLSAERKDALFTVRVDRLTDEILSTLKGRDVRIYAEDKQFYHIDEDVLYVSPSIRRDIPALNDAVKRGVTLSSECELFFQSNKKDVYAVTGSDGKSTVCHLTNMLLPNSPMLGNCGTPFSLAEKERDCYAAELSSFQLSYCLPVCKSAAITNITPNHLNWHRDYSEYRQTKLNIMENADNAVIPDDDEIYDSINHTRHTTVFSVKSPLKELRERFKAEGYITIENGNISYNGKWLVSISEIVRREEHNIKNLMCAIGLTIDTCDSNTVRRVASTFTGIDHRCQSVGQIDGITYIDSSIDTTPKRCATTLLSLGKGVRLILGGRGKGLSYEPLRYVLPKYADTIGVYGEAGEEIHSFLKNIGIDEEKISVCEKFDDAFRFVKSNGSADTLLLSPAATAYGEFADYKERADRFRKLINM